MNWLKVIVPPKTNYSSLVEEGKFNLIWNVSLILVPIFTILLIMHLVMGDTSWVTSLSALVIAVSNLFILNKSRKYNIVGWVSVLTGVFITQAAIFLVDDSRLLADAMWCILISFFTFFLFGNLSGFLVLMLNLTGLMAYQFYATPEQLATKGITPDMVDGKMLINVYYVAIALSFILSRMQQNNRDINRRYEEQIRHNELLIKEVHHRVKNNLQIMASLLRLQAAETKNDQVVSSLEAAIGRVSSMAFIHEKMYKKENLVSIKFSEYMNSLLDSILIQVNSDKNIQCDVKSDEFMLNPDALVSLSLLINELATNSIKHAFNGTGGMLSIRAEMKGDKLSIEYRDNGKWKEPSEESTFGRELIQTLTEHLDGNVTYDVQESGTSYFFVFPKSIVLHT